MDVSSLPIPIPSGFLFLYFLTRGTGGWGLIIDPKLSPDFFLTDMGKKTRQKRSLTLLPLGEGVGSAERSPSLLPVVLLL